MHDIVDDDEGKRERGEKRIADALFNAYLLLSFSSSVFVFSSKKKKTL